MSKKRTSVESCIDTAEEQTNNGAAPDVPQDEDNAKRVKLTSFISDTTLQDLPIELIECILIQVVAMEVKSMKLAKSVWTEKAELVINRLAAVCWQWSSVLSTDGFRTRLDRALEAQGTIRLETLQQHTIPFNVSDVTAVRDEVFLLCRIHVNPGDDYINVYDWNNMAEVKYFIPLPGLRPESIVACTMSNCVYIVNRKQRNHCSILRITGDSDPRWSTPSEVIGDINLPGYRCCATANGSLILSRKQTIRIPAISIFDANGSLKQTIRLPSDITEFYEMIAKPNGNLVLRGSHLSYYDEDGDGDNDDDDDDGDDGDDDDDDNNNDDGYNYQATLSEIDMNGTKIRQYVCPLDLWGNLCILHSGFVDSHGRMLAVSDRNGMQVLDSEFNAMDDCTCPKFDFPQSRFPSIKFHYNSERNEAIMIDQVLFIGQARFTVFHLEEL